MDRRTPTAPSVWLGLAGGCFLLTAVVYTRYGFVSGFLPLLGGIYAARRWLLGRTVEASREHDDADRTGLAERYEVETDGEYTADEQTALLSEVRSDYRGKHHLWGGLAVLCGVVAVAAAFVSAALTVCSVAVAGYCGLRWYRVREALAVLDGRLQALADDA